MFAGVLNDDDGRRATEVVEAVLAHGIRCALTGGLAIDVRLREHGRPGECRSLNDIDFVVEDFASIPESLAGAFFQHHVHPDANDGRTLLQLVDQPRAIRVDLFCALGGIERGMAEALKRGYATASTDTGHTGDTAAPLLGHPEKLVDFAYRAVHEMTVTAKAIIGAFYEVKPKLSYWNACSTGGRQGLIEAQRFPDDYDGIIAGAPPISQTRLVTWSTHIGHVVLKDPRNEIPSSKYPMIHRAVVNACDAVDGTEDGLIDDPGRCRFDFKTIECKAEDSASCLTAAQVESARTIANPVIHPQTGETIFPGLAMGTELGWGLRIGGPTPQRFGTDYFKYVFYKDPDWDWRSRPSRGRDQVVANSVPNTQPAQQQDNPPPQLLPHARVSPSSLRIPADRDR